MYGVPTEYQMERIASLVGYKWYLVGLHLGVDQAELKRIYLRYKGDGSLCCFELFQKWAAEEVSTSCPFTWKGLIETLDNDYVRESSLARYLEDRYLS